MKVKINRYNPIIIDLRLYIMGTIVNFSIVDYAKHFFTVTDETGLKFSTYSEALNYCENQEYEVENNV